MKKILNIGLLISVLLLLTACGTDQSAVANTEEEIAHPAEAYEPSEDDSSTVGETVQEQSRNDLRGDFAENALAPVSQLILGTFLMEETEYAVDADLAPYLTPYWKLYRSLLESDTTAPEELAALIGEIQEVMDAEQVNYIASLELTQEDLMTYMNESGIMENIRPEGAEEGENGERPGRPDGMPEGTGPGGGQGGLGAGEGMDPEVMATMQAEREATGDGDRGANQMITPLLEALIELLESKTS